MRCAVLGDPIEHSLSPALHRAGFAAVGLDWAYDAVRVPAGALADHVAGLDRDEWRGLSVTAPLKREALALASRASERARQADAANTLLLHPDGVSADNTDVPGLVDALRERGVEPSSVTILGGGATAASTVVALGEMGLHRVQVLVRDPSTLARTRSVAAACGVTLEVGALDSPVLGDLVVSTIPASAETPRLVESCLRARAVFEVVYDPWPTPLAAAAAQAGLVVVDGLDLLAHQAAHQFEAFTGLVVAVDVLRDAGREELRRRAA